MWNAGIPDHVVVSVCWTLESVDLITKGTENAGNPQNNDEWAVNPSTVMSDQDRISLYDINTLSSGQVTRIKKNTS